MHCSLNGKGTASGLLDSALRNSGLTYSYTPHYSVSGLIVVGALCWVVCTFGSVYFTRWSALKYTTMTTWLGLITIVVTKVHPRKSPKLKMTCDVSFGDAGSID